MVIEWKFNDEDGQLFMVIYSDLSNKYETFTILQYIDYQPFKLYEVFLLAQYFPNCTVMPVVQNLNLDHHSVGESMMIKRMEWGILFSDKAMHRWGCPKIGLPGLIIHVSIIFPNQNRPKPSILGIPHGHGNHQIAQDI